MREKRNLYGGLGGWCDGVRIGIKKCDIYRIGMYKRREMWMNERERGGDVGYEYNAVLIIQKGKSVGMVIIVCV